MNEYEDLFKTNEELPVTPDKPITDPNHDFFEMERENKINRNLIIIYIAISLAITLFSMLYGSLRFPNSDQLISNIVVTRDITIETTESDLDPAYPYVITITGWVKNTNDEEIPSVYLELDFLTATNEDIGLYTLSIENLGPNEVWYIHDEIYSSDYPDSYTIAKGIDETSMFYLLLNFTQVFVTAILFLLIDKSNFRKDWKGFKKNPGVYIGQIIVGYLMVFAALYASQLLLQYLGVTDTSQNENAIASMFTDNIFNLVMLFLLLCVFTPIVEELVFRKATYGLIEKKFGYLPAIIGSGLIFGLMHVIAYMDFIQSIPYIAMGLVFGYVYYRSNKNIYVTIGVHFINNFLAWGSYVILLYGVTQ